MERDPVKPVLETLLFITDRPLSAPALSKLLEVEETEVAQAVAELRSELESRGSALRIVEVGGGFQFATQARLAPWVRKLYGERLTMRLSQPARETLAIIAYRQPITRAEIEQIRGVEAIASLESLLEKSLIRVAGRKETVGRPLLYGTTLEFLRHFGLNGLGDLPDLDGLAPSQTAPALVSAAQDSSLQKEPDA